MQQQTVAVETLSTGQGIPRAQWARFLEHLSQEHRGERATLELRSPDSGDPVVVHYRRFRMIAADEDYGLDRITIVMENPSGNAMMHTISKATQVQFADKLRSTLTIATMSGTVAVLRFSQQETPGQ
jgi:hypothetical protein